MTLISAFYPVVALALVLGLILVARRLVSWTKLVPGNSSPPGRLALVQTIALDSRRRLALVQCDARHVLLLTGGGQDVVVGWLDAAPRA